MTAQQEACFRKVVLKVGDDVSTDAIYPGRFMATVLPSETPQFAFADPHRVIAEDLSHSGEERRYFCFGRVAAGILTVRFTHRTDVIRIFGAGYWRKGERICEHETQVHG